MLKGLAAWCIGATGLASPLLRWRPRLKRLVTILCYHRVLPVDDLRSFPFDIDVLSATPREFEWQMQFLRRHMAPISVSQLVSAVEDGRTLPPRSVLVTFDDGYDDCHNHALPILEKFSIPATVFVTSGYIDSQEPYWFDRLAYTVLHTQAARLEIPGIGIVVDVPISCAERRELYRQIVGLLKDVPDHTRVESLQHIWRQSRVALSREAASKSLPMSSEQLASASRRGLAVHSHTVNHPILSKITREEVEFELRESRQMIARVTDLEPDVLAYPNGTWQDFGSREIEVARSCGYRAAMTYEVGAQSLADMDPFRLLRLPVNHNHSRRWFRTMLAIPEVASMDTLPLAAPES
jgi:peptidoglycan/xylan/chitin deacetylase (PgdA/CDA1 family)